jgi:hypothetical protein
LRASVNSKTQNAMFRQRKTGCQHSLLLNLTTEKLCRSENSQAIRRDLGRDRRRYGRLRAKVRRCSSSRFLYAHALTLLASVARVRMHPSLRYSRTLYHCACEAYIFIYFTSTRAALVSESRTFLSGESWSEAEVGSRRLRADSRSAIDFEQISFSSGFFAATSDDMARLRGRLSLSRYTSLLDE